MAYYKDDKDGLYGVPDGYEPHENWTEISEEEAAKLTAPPPTAAEIRAAMPALSAWQVRKVLTQFGLRDKVEAAIAAADQNTRDAWEYANDFQRDNALLAAMAKALGMSDSELDQMFTIGATL